MAQLFRSVAKNLVNLSSNNYLGLATNEELKRIAKETIDKYGVGGAVRTINGTLDLHVKLEEKLAEFKGTEAAISYQSGFNCNMATISAVMDKNDAILSDQLNHASIIDGCRLSKAKSSRLITLIWRIYVQRQKRRNQVYTIKSWLSQMVSSQWMVILLNYLKLWK